MDCKDIKERLSAYMDAELDAALMKAVTDHVEACESCREELGRMEAAWRLLESVSVPEPSPGLKRRIVQGAARRTAPRTRVFSLGSFRRWPMSLAAAAAIFFGVVFGGLLGRVYVNEPQETAAPQTTVKETTAAALQNGEDVFSELPEGTVGWYLADLLVVEETSSGDEEDAK
jgi:anti-sigma factor RsiW